MSTTRQFQAALDRAAWSVSAHLTIFTAVAVCVGLAL